MTKIFSNGTTDDRATRAAPSPGASTVRLRRAICSLAGAILVACSSATPEVRIVGTETVNSPPPTPRQPQKEQPPPAGPVVQRPFPVVAHAELDNGLSIDLIERHALPVATLALVSASGSATDADHPGAARVTALFLEAGGAGRWSSKELRETVDGLGATLDISTNRDADSWELSVTSDRVDGALDILGALVRAPKFAPGEFRRLKERQIERVRSLEKTSGMWLARYWLNRALYELPVGIHPYASVDVLPDELQRLTLADCRAWYQKHVTPKNVRLIAVGDLKLDQLVAQARRVFGAWKSQPAAPLSAPEPVPPKGPQIVVLDRPSSTQSDVMLGVLGPSRHDSDFANIYTMQQVIGGGVAGRLFLDIREKRSLAYATYAGTMDVREGPSVLYLAAGTQTAKTAETVGLLLEHLERAGSGPVGAEELETARRYLIDGMPARWETVEGLADQWLTVFELGLGDDYYDTLRADIARSTPASVEAAASKYYRLDRSVVVVAGDARSVAQDLATHGPVDVLSPEQGFRIRQHLDARR